MKRVLLIVALLLGVNYALQHLPTRSTSPSSARKAVDQAFREYRRDFCRIHTQSAKLTQAKKFKSEQAKKSWLTKECQKARDADFQPVYKLQQSGGKRWDPKRSASIDAAIGASN